MKNIEEANKIIHKAFELHSKGNILEAAKYYQFFIDKGFKNFRVFNNYGVILKGLGKLKEAEIYIRKSIQLNPTYAIANSNLGGILKDLRKLKEAEIYTRKSIELNSNFADAHLNLGSILQDVGKLKEAEQSTRKAIELNPNEAKGYSNLGGILKDLGKLKEAEVSTRKAIELNSNYADAHLNLGSILKDLDKLKEAEQSTRKAIELNPNEAKGYSNLGSILKDLGKLKEAEVYILKAIQLNPDLTIAYFSFSTFKLSEKNKIWRDKLFSKNLLNKKSTEDIVNIYFARANILHKESNFKESTKYLQLANNYKKNIDPTDFLLEKSKQLMLETNNEIVNEDKHKNFPNNIFIVGMPRSGSTLVESILSMNNNVNDLGEKNILEESFLKWKNPLQKSTLADLYFKQTNNFSNKLKTTTNKWLLNYLYTGIISTHIPNAKIIHCFRNPLDNILSIYRAHFAKGTQYSSSLTASAKVYLNQEEIMTSYKKRFRSKIYDLNYDSLVNNPTQEIKSLISWLGWQWDDQYLSPHLNPRAVSTASNIEVRSPINSKSLGIWKNYKEMLKPAMEIIIQNNKYQDLVY